MDYLEVALKSQTLQEGAIIVTLQKWWSKWVAGPWQSPAAHIPQCSAQCGRPKATEKMLSWWCECDGDDMWAMLGTGHTGDVLHNKAEHRVTPQQYRPVNVSRGNHNNADINTIKVTPGECGTRIGSISHNPSPELVQPVSQQLMPSIP